jgi:uncharacterized protein YkwD
MKIGFIVGLIILCVLGMFGVLALTNQQPAEGIIISMPTPTINPDATTKSGLLDTINKWRVSQNLNPYTESEFLCKVAEDRLPEIVKEFNHDKLNYKRWCDDCYISENIAQGYYTNKETLDGWLASPSHKAALLRNYTHTCFSTNGSESIQIFGYY